MKKIIKNGTIVTAADTYHADILIENENDCNDWKGTVGYRGQKSLMQKALMFFQGALIHIPISICRLEGQRQRMILKQVRLLLHMEARQRSSTFV